MHNHIKNLADDVNPFMIDHDARGLPIARYGAAAGRLTQSPNDNVERTTHSVYNIAVIPTNAVTAHVSMSVAAQAAANAQCWWKPMFSGNNGTMWFFLYNVTAGNGYVNSHNQSQPAINLGFAVSGIFDVRPYRGGQLALAVNSFNDPGSGAWIDNAYMEWAITLMS
jgi:hypothetical protein